MNTIVFFKELVDKHWKLIGEKYPRMGSDVPTLEFNPNLKTTYARAYLFENRIMFGMPSAIATLESVEHVVVHEIVHFVDYAYNKNFGHRASFKKIMRSLGMSDSICHPQHLFQADKINKLELNLDCYYHYKCTCNDYFLIKRTHNAIQKGEGAQCNKCKEWLKFQK